MATELAKAYVQIVPSADGIKGKLEQMLGKETGSAGKKAGDNIAGSIKKAILKLGIGALVVKGVSSALSSISGLVSESLSAFADTEQLTGGVEKLFDIDADKVIENANNAFKTIGISANDYMETVTSFAASLINSLEGDTSKAADLADQALIDMADNANTFGTDIASIQNAYQGFAKQNYTMLDNLKLGFGGTEAEMERLLETASELTGVDYDIESFADIVEAIHVVQENMGITGTTANEAITTISGSTAMLKASWENFLGSMAQGDDRIAETTQNLVDSFVGVVGQMEKVLPTIIPNLINALVNVINALIPVLPGMIDVLLPPVITGIESLLSGLLTILPQLMQVLVDVLPMAIDVILQMLPLLLQTAIDLVVVLAKGIVEALPTLVPAVVDIILILTDTLLDNVDMLIDVSIQLILALAKGIVNALPVLAAKAPEIIKKLVVALGNALGQLYEFGGKFMDIMVSAISGPMNKLVTLAGTIWSKFKEAIVKAFDGIKDVGKNVIEGLKEGILGGVSKVTDAAKSVANNVLTGVKNLFGIHSPSKEFAWIGEMCDEGLAEGLEGMSDTVADAKAGIRAEMAEGMDFNTSITASGVMNGQLAASTASGLAESEMAGAVANAVYNALNNLTIRAEMNPNTAKFFESMRAEAVAFQRRTGNEAWA